MTGAAGAESAVGAGRGALVVGYGNALRTDDGLGWHAAARLAADPRLAGATVLQRHQLTPELAFDVGCAAFVVFVDAGSGPPGAIAVEPVVAAPTSTVTWSHHVDPASLLSLARDLYGRVPTGATVSVGTSSMEAGEGVTPLIAAVLPQVVETVVDLVRAASKSATAAAEPAAEPVVAGRA